MRGARIINRRSIVLNPPEESLQEKSWREWQENFARVSADPESASITDLMRAIGYLDKVRSSIQRHAWDQGKKVDANVIAGYENEEQYYQRLIEQKQGRRSNPYVPIPAPHELFYRAHQGLSGSWDVRRAGYHGKLEILESGLTESKARALAASANAEIRTEREAFFETQPLGSFVAGHNPEWFGYYPRFVPEGLWNELVNLWHLSRVPFSGIREGARYKGMLWTSDEFHKAHPEISSTAAYKDLDGFLAYSGK